MRRSLLAVVALSLLAACGQDEAVGSASTPATTASSAAGEPATPTTSAVAAELAAMGVVLCESLDETPRLVDGPLSADPDIARDQLFRAGMGLRSDAAWAEEVAAQQAGKDWAWGSPLTPEEEASMGDDPERAPPPDFAFAAYEVKFPDTYAGASVDPADGGRLVMHFSDGVAERQAELDALYDPGRIRVKQVRYSWKQLAEFSAPVGHLLSGDSQVIAVGARGRYNLVEVTMGRLDVASATAVLAVIEPDQVCFNGPYPEQLVPEGPQLAEGDGWRLLASGPGAIALPRSDPFALFSVEAVLDAQGLDALWPSVPSTKTRPKVDFGSAVVFVFNTGHGTCGPERLDGITVDGSVVYPTLVNPGPVQSCGDSFTPHFYVVAVDRADLPAGPFTVHTGRPAAQLLRVQRQSAHRHRALSRHPPARPAGAWQDATVTDSSPYLEGIRVLDFTQYLAGPACTRLLVEMGAEVIKVEMAPFGEPTRATLPRKNKRGSYFVQQTRGKRSLCLDLRRPEAIQAIKDLLPNIDIVVENFSAGVMARKGLGYDDLAAINPRIIMASISGFGQTGPLAGTTAFDFIAQAYTGIMHMTGDPDGPPNMVGMAISDTATGVHAWAGIGYALYRRDRTGKGAHLDVSLVDSMYHMQEMGVHAPSIDPDYVPMRNGRHYGPSSPAGVFKAAEGWIVVFCTQNQVLQLWDAMGRPDMAEDPRFATNDLRIEHRDALTAEIEAWMAGFERDGDILAVLGEHRVPCGPVLRPDQLGDSNPHFRERGTVRVVHDPLVGDVTIPGFPIKFSDAPPLADLVAPNLGADNRSVLAELAGYDDARIADLEATGVLTSKDR